MKNILFIIPLLILSCSIKKESSKEKKDIEFLEKIETREFRKGDTVTYIVPVIKYKDTVITTVSTQGTILKTYFDKSGEVYKTDCTASEIELLRLELRSLSDQSKTKEQKKEEDILTQFIPYLFGFLAIIIISILILFFMMYRISKKIPTIVSP